MISMERTNTTVVAWKRLVARSRFADLADLPKLTRMVTLLRCGVLERAHLHDHGPSQPRKVPRNYQSQLSQSRGMTASDD